MVQKTKASASQVREELGGHLKQWGWNKSGIVALCRGGGSSSKGSSYEREMCKRFSLWWTKGERDDIFWRSSGSGARAKVRGRAGRDTAGQHGDMAATDPVGKPFIDAFTVEMKRGYSDHTFQDLLDMNPGAGVQVFEGFIQQTIESHHQAGSQSWLLITRRDRRAALVWMPTHTFHIFRGYQAFYPMPVPFVRTLVTGRSIPMADTDQPAACVDVCCMTLDAFLTISPDTVMASMKGSP